MKASFLILALILLSGCGEKTATSEIESGQGVIHVTEVNLNYTQWYNVPAPYAGVLRGHCLETPSVGCEIVDDPDIRECSFECTGPVVVTLKDNEWACDDSFWNVAPELYSIQADGEFLYQSLGNEKIIEIEAGDIICD